MASTVVCMNKVRKIIVTKEARNLNNYSTIPYVSNIQTNNIHSSIYLCM